MTTNNSSNDFTQLITVILQDLCHKEHNTNKISAYAYIISFLHHNWNSDSFNSSSLLENLSIISASIALRLNPADQLSHCPYLSNTSTQTTDEYSSNQTTTHQDQASQELKTNSVPDDVIDGEEKFVRQNLTRSVTPKSLQERTQKSLNRHNQYSDENVSVHKLIDQIAKNRYDNFNAEFKPCDRDKSFERCAYEKYIMDNQQKSSRSILDAAKKQQTQRYLNDKATGAKDRLIRSDSVNKMYFDEPVSDVETANKILQLQRTKSTEQIIKEFPLSKNQQEHTSKISESTSGRLGRSVSSENMAKRLLEKDAYRKSHPSEFDSYAVDKNDLKEFHNSAIRLRRSESKQYIDDMIEQQEFKKSQQQNYKNNHKIQDDVRLLIDPVNNPDCLDHYFKDVIEQRIQEMSKINKKNQK